MRARAKSTLSPNNFQDTYFNEILTKMKVQQALFLAVFWCAAVYSVTSTGILFGVLKSGVLQTRCKLHLLGTKLIQHGHSLDPCESVENSINVDENTTTKESTTLRMESEKIKVTSESYPSSLDIDIRMGSDTEDATSSIILQQGPHSAVSRLDAHEDNILLAKNFEAIPPHGDSVR